MISIMVISKSSPALGNILSFAGTLLPVEVSGSAKSMRDCKIQTKVSVETVQVQEFALYNR